VLHHNADRSAGNVQKGSTR